MPQLDLTSGPLPAKIMFGSGVFAGFLLGAMATMTFFDAARGAGPVPALEVTEALPPGPDQETSPPAESDTSVESPEEGHSADIISGGDQPVDSEAVADRHSVSRSDRGVEFSDVKRSEITKPPIDDAATIPGFKLPDASEAGEVTRNVNPRELSFPSQGIATLAYWKKVGQIIRSKAPNRALTVETVTVGNAREFFATRIRESRQVLDALAGADADQVDSDVTLLVSRIRARFEAAIRNSTQGLQLLEADAGSRGENGRLWKENELKLTSDTAQLKAQATTIRAHMSEQYSEEFPDLL